MNKTKAMKSLFEKMVERANLDKLPDCHPMRVRAKEFEDVLANPDARFLLGAWARARRVWCDYTGEELI
jgi:hypothetical protein